MDKKLVTHHYHRSMLSRELILILSNLTFIHMPNIRAQSCLIIITFISGTYLRAIYQLITALKDLVGLIVSYIHIITNIIKMHLKIMSINTNKLKIMNNTLPLITTVNSTHLIIMDTITMMCLINLNNMDKANLMNKANLMKKSNLMLLNIINIWVKIIIVIILDIWDNIQIDI